MAGYARSYIHKLGTEAAAKRVTGVVGVTNDIEVRLPNFDERPDPDIARDAVAALRGLMPFVSNHIRTTVADDMLTIRGEKKEESERKEHDHHATERSYGTFSRTLRLPFAVDAGQAKAAFKDGVLRITIPKTKEVQQRTHRIEVRREETGPTTASHPSTSQARRASEQPPRIKSVKNVGASRFLARSASEEACPAPVSNRRRRQP